ncbi:MAG: 3-dehydroquinate synthase [Thermoplasmataceae archaeon]|jgi:3-dehydroquinate synthase|nr:MAG: hypothetical protein AMDU2_EPLC00005G0546 [Thermoplasmatales archaeon E-plasma]
MTEAERFILKRGEFETTYIIGEKILKHIWDYCNDNQKAIFIVSKNVDEKFQGYLPDFGKIGEGSIKFTVSDGENLKNIKSYQKIMSVMLENQIEKNSLIGYVGGGTVGDMTGFVAATYKRGMKLMAIPTTLLSQVDSSIGGKNGINYGGVKNVIGTFYEPSVVLADTHFLTASEDSYLKDGLGEIIKYAIIEKTDIFSVISQFSDLHDIKNNSQLTRLISKSIRIKHDIVSRDFYDQNGIRAKLNFGHTVGHALESISKSAVSHGRAIVTGMLVESLISKKMGIAEDDFHSIITELMNKFSIKPVNTAQYSIENMLNIIRNDKKARDGKIYISIPVKLGEMSLNAVPIEIIREALDEFSRNR